jgi:hypothetical protein
MLALRRYNKSATRAFAQVSNSLCLRACRRMHKSLHAVEYVQAAENAASHRTRNTSKTPRIENAKFGS